MYLDILNKVPTNNKNFVLWIEYLETSIFFFSRKHMLLTRKLFHYVIEFMAVLKV